MLPFYDGASLFGEGGSPKLDLFQPWLALVAEVSTDVELRAIRDVFDAAIWEWETANHFASVLHLLQSGAVESALRQFPSVLTALQAAAGQWQRAADWLSEYGESHKATLYAPLFEQVALHQQRLRSRQQQLQMLMSRYYEEWNVPPPWLQGQR